MKEIASYFLTAKTTDLLNSDYMHSRYLITGYNASQNPSIEFEDNDKFTAILFQNGIIKDVGYNGINHEILLKILIDRIENSQTGPLKCVENDAMLFHLKQTLSINNIITKKINKVK